ncbi:MAG TPA: YCF48-related protein, partial [Pyrinomonadaceae bacterium]
MLFLLTAHCLLPTAFAAGAWTKQRSGSLAWLHAVYFLDENRGWAVGGRGALLSTNDGGDTWRLSRRPTEDALRDVYFSDEQNGWLVCERSIYDLKTKEEPRTYLLRTMDGGESW